MCISLLSEKRREYFTLKDTNFASTNRCLRQEKPRPTSTAPSWKITAATIVPKDFASFPPSTASNNAV